MQLVDGGAQQGLHVVARWQKVFMSFGRICALLMTGVPAKRLSWIWRARATRARMAAEDGKAGGMKLFQGGRGTSMWMSRRSRMGPLMRA